MSLHMQINKLLVHLYNGMEKLKGKKKDQYEKTNY